jgi:hypothetical protein
MRQWLTSFGAVAREPGLYDRIGNENAKDGQDYRISLKEIAAINNQLSANDIPREHKKEIMSQQLTKLEIKATALAAAISQLRAKLAWMEAEGVGPEPHLNMLDCVVPLI